VASDTSTERNLAFLCRRRQEELARARAASRSEDRIGHLALARAFARQIDRQRAQGEPDRTGQQEFNILKIQ